MFEKIHFQKEILKNITNLRKVNDVIVENPSPEASTRFLHEYNMFKNCTYCVDGESMTVPARIISDYAGSHLLYVLSFSLIRASSLYFTRREDADAFVLIYTYDGTGYVEYEGHTYYLRPGDGILIDCRRPHYYRSETNLWEHCVLHFSGERVPHLYSKFMESQNASFHEEKNSHFHKELEKLILIYDSVLPYWEDQVSAQLETLLIHILTNTDHYLEMVRSMPEKLKYLIKYMESNYDQSLSMDYFAEFTGFSKYYLAHLFKKHLDMSPNEYLIQLRIREAQRLLKDSDFPANQICRMVGIEDENYFYRLFKKKSGLTPNQYRKENTHTHF